MSAYDMNKLANIIAEKERIQQARLQAEIRAYENMRKQTSKPVEALARRNGQYDQTIAAYDADTETRRATRLSTQGRKRAGKKRKIEVSPVIHVVFN